MQLFIQNGNFSFQSKDFVLNNPNVDGIVLNLPVSIFIGFQGKGYNDQQFKLLTDNIKLNFSHGKKSAICIAWGRWMPVIAGIEYLNFIEAHKNNPDEHVPIQEPIFYQDAYMDFVYKFYSELKKRLKDSGTYDMVEYIKFSCVTDLFFELRMSDFDNTGVGDPYENAAKKWLNAGYYCDNVRACLKSMLDNFYDIFPDMKVCVPVIGNKNGFPKIADDGSIGDRPDIALDMVNYILKYPLFAPQTSAVTEKVQSVPPFVYLSGAKNIIAQLAESIFANVLRGEQPSPQLALDNAKAHNANYAETFEKSLFKHPNQHG